ncbi:MAG: cytochrome C oxidase subunit IV family protein [Caulobacterales bacterium]
MNILKLRITWIWALLVAATCFSWESVQGFQLFSDVRWATALVMVVAFIKVRFIMMEFMEIRQAPLPLRIFADVWVAAVCTAILVMYWANAS